MNPPQNIRIYDDTVNTADGHPLACRFHLPAGEARAAALIVPAMGTSQGYYGSFAAWLAANGIAAATFDFRGMGASRRGGLRGFDATILDWTRLDCAAVLDALAVRAPGVPLVWVGHSLGGQTLPFLPGNDCIDRAVFVASGNGYWRENASPTRWRALLLWYVLGPPLVALYGYLPGRRLRIVGDLPVGVYRQWRSWCLHPDYALGVENAADLYDAVRIPVLSLSFTDDEMMSATNTAKLETVYKNADLRRLRLSPEDLGVARIGHFGCFRQQFEESIWRRHLLGGIVGDD